MSVGSLSIRLLQQVNARAGHNLPVDAVEEAWSRIKTPGTMIPMERLRRRGEWVYRPVAPVDRLLENATNAILIECLSVRQANRNEIVADLGCLLREGTPLRVYRLDIKSFYESVPKRDLLDRLKRNWRVPRQTIDVLGALFAQSQNDGLPRGLSVSSTLSELLMKPFDEHVRMMEGVFYYARFVDDIIILTLGSEDPAAFQRELSVHLNAVAPSLAFNAHKTTNTEFELESHSFSYLGYRFSLGEDRSRRQGRALKVDIASSKVQRMKTRVCLSLLAHHRSASSASFALLRDRLRLLSGNYYVGQRNEHQKLRAGIYYSYTEVTECTALIGLDTFLRRLMNGTTSPISHKAKASLTAAQRRELLQLSFLNGHRRRLMLSFNSGVISELTRCWRHV